MDVNESTDKAANVPQQEVHTFSAVSFTVKIVVHNELMERGSLHREF